MSDKQSGDERLKALEERISAVKKSQEPAPRADEHYSMANQAWRMVIELVAGLAIGFGIGYGLDSLFGTMPIFLVLFIGFGFAAGVKVMMRTAQEVANEHAPQSGDVEQSPLQGDIEQPPLQGDIEHAPSQGEQEEKS